MSERADFARETYREPPPRTELCATCKHLGPVCDSHPYKHFCTLLKGSFQISLHGQCDMWGKKP